MRMWMINPKCLCSKHLRGEHYEIHKLIGNLLHGRSIQGYISGHLVEPQNFYSRHDELALEMIQRGMEHKSPLVKVEFNIECVVNKNKSIADLMDRCPECKERILKEMTNEEIRHVTSHDQLQLQSTL